MSSCSLARKALGSRQHMVPRFFGSVHREEDDLERLPSTHVFKCWAWCVQGTLFHDRMKPEELQKIKKGLVALEEEYLQLHPGATVQCV